MTVRTYELDTSFKRLCEICCEPHRELTMPLCGVGLDIRVEGGPIVPFAVCESCVHNMMRPFQKGNRDE